MDNLSKMVKTSGTRLTSARCDSRLLEKSADGSVLIGRRGWYALFAGPFSLDANASDDQTTTDKDIKDRTDGCRVELSSVLDSRQKILHLPMECDGKALIDPHVGKAIYIEEGETRARLCAGAADDSRQASSGPKIDVANDTPWFLYKLEDPVSTKLPANETPKRKKCLVCRDCLRSFANWGAMRSHRLEKHRLAKRRRLTKNGSGEDDVWDTPLSVVYQDSHIAIIDKPQNMAVHGARPSLMRSDLLMDLSLSKEEAATLLEEHFIHALRKPRPAHRLDAATGGILVVAKTEESERIVKSALADRKCQKRYLALLVGKLVEDMANEDGKSFITTPVEGKESVTEYRVVRYVDSVDKVAFTLVDLWPHTGRNHQLRRHMKSLRHPIVGDKRYGGPESQDSSTKMKNVHSRLCLWAVNITLEHPYTKELRSFGIDEPKWLTDLVSVIQTSNLKPTT